MERASALLRAHESQKGKAFENEVFNGDLAIGDEGYESTGVGREDFLAGSPLYQQEILKTTYVASKSSTLQTLPQTSLIVICACSHVEAADCNDSFLPANTVSVSTPEDGGG